ncbi:FHA domain-containing protein [bacterium]|jgi:pSer/pThr/pTyr-binding forkhead associated (FHA) protein|nr:FHA domain-containing protein [Planctomicrobium sp.]MDB4439761.1 FHA domain-containing protein [Planctomicrobium sp.]MDB4802435.1 FHA domain-containing protein [bacterium]
MWGELIPVGGGDTIPLLEKKILIGRRSSCEIVLSFPNVSSQHCELNLIDGYWEIRDLGSSNGIKVNGERYDQKWLHPGDEISIAKNHFEIMYEPTGDAPPEEDDPFELGLLEKAGLQKQAQQRRRAGPPPAAKKPDKKQSFGAEEDAAMDWLMGDD